MKFAHIADCHLGAWRQPEMQQLNLVAFENAIDRCISEDVDFVLIAGDLFDIAIPPVDVLKSATAKLRELKERNIKCFVVHGSHDFSASGKSMISVLEKAGLCDDAAHRSLKLNVDGKNVFIAGLEGRKGGLEQNEINSKDFKNETNADLSVLMVHTTVSELANLPSAVASVNAENLPEGFDYYALGHIHHTGILENEKRLIAYTGALFPTSFSELESQHNSCFFIIEKNNGKISKDNIKQVTEQIKPVFNVVIDANGENPASLKEKIIAELEKNKSNLRDSIVTIRIEGILERGKPSELDFQSVESEAKNFGAYYVLKNISKLESKEFKLEIDEKMEGSHNIDKLEELAIDAAVRESIVMPDKKQLVEDLLKRFDLEKTEDETNSSFSSRLAGEMMKLFDFEEELE